VVVLDPRLTEADVQAVIAALAADDAEGGDLARHAWMTLSAGQGPGMITLAGLQNWAWWLLPKRSYADEYDWWVATVEAAARLFDRLGAPGYVAVCRSETTARVLAAWHVSRSKGLAATRRALDASPVEPPDLADFAWGTTFGVWESDARGAVEVALERAIDEGRLDPSSRTWRTTAAAICVETIDAPVPGDVAQSWRSLVQAERAEQWASGARVPPDQRNERQRVAARYLSPPPAPDPTTAAGPLRLLAWFARACAEGVTLTASGYLPPALVAEAADVHGWWEWDKPPRSEADLWQLRLVHHAAVKLGVVRRRGRTLATTKPGHSVEGDPLGWWPRLVRLGQGHNDYRDAVFEAAALAIVDGGTHETAHVRSWVGEWLVGQCWQTDGDLMTVADHGNHVYDAINPWRLWGLVDYREGRWSSTPDEPRQVEPTTVTVTDAGRAAAVLWLHHRITGPRRRL
jgi:hypothetical protein